MIVLAIETSCDETAVAVLRDGREILADVVASQVGFHQKYGGIVPEIASRKHAELINLVIAEALQKADCQFQQIEAVAVTYGPGLVGSLLVGVCAAKAIAYSLNIPLIGVNHLEAHIYANFLAQIPNTKTQITNKSEISNSNDQFPSFPFICLLVSGGHTMLVLVNDHGVYETLGRTRDDAAGEAFDKVARVLDLGYPGGPVIDKIAKQGNPKAIHFTRPMLDQGFDFSFSGIKTAVVNYLKKSGGVEPLQSAGISLADIAASFQMAVIEVLVEKAIQAAAATGCQNIVLAGGVSANSLLRQLLQTRASQEGYNVFIPPLSLCTDNAAMVGCVGYQRWQKGLLADYKLSPVASLRL